MLRMRQEAVFSPDEAGFEMTCPETPANKRLWSFLRECSHANLSYRGSPKINGPNAAPVLDSFCKSPV